MTVSYVNINGELRDASSLTFPSTGREFRDAWQFNGDVIEIDMVKAKELKIEKLARKVADRLEKAEEKAVKKSIKGQDTTEEDAEIAKFKSKPKQAGIDLVNNASTPEELDAITEDQVYA